MFRRRKVSGTKRRKTTSVARGLVKFDPKAIDFNRFKETNLINNFRNIESPADKWDSFTAIISEKHRIEEDNGRMTYIIANKIGPKENRTKAAIACAVNEARLKIIGGWEQSRLREYGARTPSDLQSILKEKWGIRLHEP